MKLGNKICVKCGRKITLSLSDKIARRTVSLSARMYPTLKTIVDGAKDYCNKCWKEVVDPAAKTLLGKKQ